MDELLSAIAAQKERFDTLCPLSRKTLANLEHYYDVELTYTSNAIEGNTLSPVETTLVIEQGLTIGGKPLKDHLDALDHYDAIRYVRELGRLTTPLTEGDMRNLHRLVMQRSATCCSICNRTEPVGPTPRSSDNWHLRRNSADRFDFSTSGA